MTQEKTFLYKLDIKCFSPEVKHAYYRERPAGIARDGLIKTSFDVTWILSGEGQCRICDTVYKYRPGDLIFIPPYVRREYVSLGVPTKYYWINFTDNPASEEKQPARIRRLKNARDAAVTTCRGGYIPVLTNDFRPDKSCFENIVRLKACSMINAPAVSELRIKDYLIRMMIEIVDFSNKSLDREKRIFSKSIHFIDTHFMDTLDIAMLARMECISKSYYISLFRKEYGITPNKYIEMRRIQHAKTMIEHQNKTIKEIAYANGFSDPYYFSKVFKAHTGLSPKNYRNSLL